MAMSLRMPPRPGRLICPVCRRPTSTWASSIFSATRTSATPAASPTPVYRRSCTCTQDAHTPLKGWRPTHRYPNARSPAGSAASARCRRPDEQIPQPTPPAVSSFQPIATAAIMQSAIQRGVTTGRDLVVACAWRWRSYGRGRRGVKTDPKVSATRNTPARTPLGSSAQASLRAV